MSIKILPIVGSHFRPPAKAFIQSLPVGQLLLLRREPTNPYDENAIMVRVVTEALPQGDQGDIFWEDFLVISVGMGYYQDNVLEEEEWHLGYIPKTEALTLAGVFDEHGRDVVGTFGYDAAGKPTVTFDPNVVYGEDEEDEVEFDEEDEEDDN
jgi:hypothetical protein